MVGNIFRNGILNINANWVFGCICRDIGMWFGLL